MRSAVAVAGASSLWFGTRAPTFLGDNKAFGGVHSAQVVPIGFLKNQIRDHQRDMGQKKEKVHQISFRLPLANLCLVAS